MSVSLTARTGSITMLVVVKARRQTTEPPEVKSSENVTFSHQKLLFVAKIKDLMSADVKSRKILKNLKENNLVPQKLKARPLVQHMYIS